MKPALLVLASLGLLVGAIAFSGDKAAAPELQLKVEERNPWNHLKLNNAADDFQFVIVSDRTGGHRPGVFSRAVEQINLLQPEFVMSVGDLIEGNKEDKAKLADEWREFQGFIERLQMPFFYVPGNHDISNKTEKGLWEEKFGRRYYHFLYRNVLFCMMDTEDPPGAAEGRMSPDQTSYFKKVLDENRSVRWTIVSLHKPIWTAANLEKTGWLDVEQALAGRPYTVFAGHIHHYKRFIRNGQRYYQLATTGGSSKMRGLQYGEFDHLVWVTMKKDGPVLANLMMDGIFPEDMKQPVTSEPGVKRTLKATAPARGQVFYRGKPLAGATVVFHPTALAELKLPRADAMTAEDGSFVLSTYTAGDGACPGVYKVTVTLRRVEVEVDGKASPNLLPEKYSKTTTSGLEVTIAEGMNEFRLELSD
jgi:calcineurin-like phosphoesterase family protein